MTKQTKLARFADWLLDTRLGTLTHSIVAIAATLSLMYGLLTLFAALFNQA